MLIIFTSHLLILTLLLLAKLTTSTDINSQHYSHSTYPLLLHCDQQSIEVRHPFTQKINDDDEQQYSYTSLITCHNGHAATDINGVKYYIRSIDYDQKTLVIAPVIVVDHLKNFTPCTTSLTPFYNNSVTEPFSYTNNTVTVGVSFCFLDGTIFDPLFCLTSENCNRKGSCSCCYGSVDKIMHHNYSYESDQCMVSGYFYALKDEVHKDLEFTLQSGFEMTWEQSQNFNYFAGHHPKALIPVGVAISFIICLLVCLGIWRKRITMITSQFLKTKTVRKDNKRIESFMIKYGSLFPKRYSYSDVQDMTCSFTDKLGQGGFGTVYKGKLADGSQVAVKVLNRSKATGSKDFFNEVICIGCTYHMNIVTLLGFCIEGLHTSLIYEYMSNGSLDKFIHSQQESKLTIDCEKLMHIAIGIARGLDYLHHGCNVSILHFDIKPHNILLDHNFIPKIADFGLAKLSHFPDKISKMLGARGTVGYIAPEVFSRSYGGVSNKSDVYSYGMMILEMVAGRKNLEVRVNHTSDIYFPHWIYKQLENCGKLRSYTVATMSKYSEEMARRMILVGLWCIQTNPMDRPSMKMVLEMLEGRFEELRMPPMPVLNSPFRSPQLSSSTHFQTSETNSCMITINH